MDQGKPLSSTRELVKTGIGPQTQEIKDSLAGLNGVSRGNEVLRN